MYVACSTLSFSKLPLANLDLADDKRAILRNMTYFSPLPFVRRVVFLAALAFERRRRISALAPDGTAIEEQRQARIVRHPSVRCEPESRRSRFRIVDAFGE